LPDRQAAEDPKYSEVAKVDLKKVFGKRTVSRKFAAARVFETRKKIVVK
jgi:hypothetical protein